MSRILDYLTYCVITLSKVQEDLDEIKGLLERAFPDRPTYPPVTGTCSVVYPEAGERLLRNPVFDRADHACERCGRKYMARGGHTPSDRWLKVREFPDCTRAASCCNCYGAPGDTLEAWKESFT